MRLPGALQEGRFAGGRLDTLGALLTAVAAGGLAGAAHPPFEFLPGLLGYAILLLLLDGATGPRPRRSGFARGWAFGFGYVLIGTYWIGEPFLVDAAAHGWMAPFVVALLPLGLGLFWGAAGLLYRVLAGERLARSALRPVLFAACLSLTEWLRGHVLTGFPWDLPGSSFTAGSPMSQSAALVGAYGLTFIVVAVASAPALLALEGRRAARGGLLAAAALVAAGLWAWGAQRLERALPSSGRPPIVRVVQANVDQKDKWRAENLAVIVGDYVGLSAAPAARAPDIIVWPESAIPAAANDFLNPASPHFQQIAGALRPGQLLLTGAFRVEPDPASPQGFRPYNSLLALERTAGELRLIGVFDKHRLVPFGEFMPLSELMGALGITALVNGPGDFAQGPEPRPLDLGRFPRVQPLICYESLFPGFVSTRGGRPAWIVNVSNDAWFGRTSGPLQHLNLASYRAIERGLPIVRATPTGVSAVIDAYGRVLPGARVEIGEAGFIDRALPSALAPTIYERWGDVPFWVMVLLGFAAAAPGVRRR